MLNLECFQLNVQSFVVKTLSDMTLMSFYEGLLIK